LRGWPPRRPVYINIGGTWGKDFIALSAPSRHGSLRNRENRVAVMSIMRSFIVGVVLAGCLAGTAHAQRQQAPEKTGLQIEEEQRKKDAEVVDKQYKETLERVKKNTNTTENRPADPWQNMRGPSDSNTKR
jgi:hypothetical protein